MKKSKSSAQWLRDHEDDEFVRRARKEGYRSRASFKLIEIDEKFRLIKPGMCIIDLGAAPGGWSQVAQQRIGRTGRVIALDILDMTPIEGVTFIRGDFTEDEPLQQLIDEISGTYVDLVISDMAPNLSGVKDIDQPRAAYLVELAVELADRVLAKEGALVVKCFEGEGINDIRAAFRERFEKVHNFKPRASRGKSREIYVIGSGHRTDPSL